MCVLLLTERRAAQLESPQVFHARGEREGGCVDCGRVGVLQAPATEALGVSTSALTLSWVARRGGGE